MPADLLPLYGMYWYYQNLYMHEVSEVTYRYLWIGLGGLGFVICAFLMATIDYITEQDSSDPTASELSLSLIVMAMCFCTFFCAILIYRPSRPLKPPSPLRLPCAQCHSTSRKATWADVKKIDGSPTLRFQQASV